jgi:hypothetical protein
MRLRIRTALVTALIFTGFCFASARADEVTDWTLITLKALQVAGQNPGQSAHSMAIVEASVFDAVNGVKGHYTPIHVTPAAPKGTSARAAAVQAAYTSLMHLFPAQANTFNAARDASLAAILDVGGGDKHHDKVEASVAAGVAWGQDVADAIWAWRSTDGYSTVLPPFLGGTAVGEWRPTPPAFLPGATPQWATMTPWVIATPSQFRPAGPPALTSALYAQVFNETKIMGSVNSQFRTADQTLYAQFWQSATVSYFWNTVAMQLLAAQNDMTLLDHARLFGALNVAMADAFIPTWDAKYTYVFWRPVTAIPLAATDGNPATDPDPGWMPLIVTPNHPEYPSAHSTISSAGIAVLVHFFGDNSSFTVDSYGMPGVTRSFTSFSDALDEVANARIYGGIHYRTSTDDGRALGTTVGNYVLENAFLPRKGNGNPDDEHD